MFRIMICNWSELTDHSLTIIRNELTQKLYKYIYISYDSSWTEDDLKRFKVIMHDKSLKFFANMNIVLLVD